jgi:hypothetical protein
MILDQRAGETLANVATPERRSSYSPRPLPHSRGDRFTAQKGRARRQAVEIPGPRGERLPTMVAGPPVAPEDDGDEGLNDASAVRSVSSWRTTTGSEATRGLATG